ncbi:hypothetical protein Droror1_Dr00021577 [Drosera rotundifolia]
MRGTMAFLNEDAIDVDSANSPESSPVANSSESYAASVNDFGVQWVFFTGCSVGATILLDFASVLWVFSPVNFAPAILPILLLLYSMLQRFYCYCTQCCYYNALAICMFAGIHCCTVVTMLHICCYYSMLQ